MLSQILRREEVCWTLPGVQHTRILQVFASGGQHTLKKGRTALGDAYMHEYPLGSLGQRGILLGHYPVSTGAEVEA